MDTTKQRTITLTDRAPVRINEAEWPQIASARDQKQGESWAIRVRLHQDGRTLVYATHEFDQRTSGRDRRGGELLHVLRACFPGGPVETDDKALAAAIHRVGEASQIPEEDIAACIADLPAKAI